MSTIFTRTITDIHYLGCDSRKLSPKGLRRKKRGRSALIGLILVAVMLISAILCISNLWQLAILPTLYLTCGIAFIAILWLYCLLSQFSRKKLAGKILSILFSAILLTGYFYSSQAFAALGLITGVTTKVDTVDVLVLKSDPASSIQDTLTYKYGYNSVSSSSVCSQAVDSINNDYKANLSVSSYSSWDDLLNALYKNTAIKAVLLNDAMYSTLKEQYTDFESRTKIVGSVKITTEITLSASDKKVNEEPFVVYISGNDEEGQISSTGRSDVNIYVVVNPKTRQVLLLSTPRDYYINISASSGVSGKDKLTHAGLSGVEYSMSALKELYGVSADYYIKVNFTGAVNVVDALGGITIDSDVDFTNGLEAATTAYHFTKGENECTGDMTLAFCRERKAFAAGDFQRGRNQMAAMKGIIKKATSAAILKNYSSVLSAVSDMIMTNMSTSTITALVRGQLTNATEWNVQSYSVSGTPSTADGQVTGLHGMSVVLPDTASVATAKELIQKIQDGQTFNVDDYK